MPTYSNTFSFCGKIQALKETAKFSPISRNESSGGFITSRAKFKVVAGDGNELIVEAIGCKWNDDKKNSIKTIAKKKENESKGERISIDWFNRFDDSEIDKVAGWKLYVFDEGISSEREKLKTTDKAKYDESLRLRHRFISNWDFEQTIESNLKNNLFGDDLYSVSGDISVSYNEKTGNYYTSYVVNKICKVANDADTRSNVTVDFYFTHGCTDVNEEDGITTVHGYISFYDNFTKKNWFSPFDLTLKIGQPAYDGFMKMFGSVAKNSVRHVTLNCTREYGADMKEITMADLDADVVELIEAGMMTLEDAQRDMGGQIVGKKHDNVVIVKLGRSTNESGKVRGPEDSAYTVDDLEMKPHKDEDDDIDMFG